MRSLNIIYANGLHRTGSHVESSDTYMVIDTGDQEVWLHFFPEGGVIDGNLREVVAIRNHEGPAAQLSLGDLLDAP